MQKTLCRSPLALAVLAALAAPMAFASNATHPHDAREQARELDEIIVTATPLDTPLGELARPATVLTGVELDERRAATLGETLQGVTGLQNASFGPGVGRPIIRGLDGPRVLVLANGLSNLDVSTVSADHAVAIEPFLAESIEILKGPANLFFGSGAIGGAINVTDNRIPTQRAERFISGRAETRFGSGNNESTQLFRLDGGHGELAWHFSGMLRDTGDISIPDYAYSAAERAEEIAEGEDPAEFKRGEVDNTSVNGHALTGGVAFHGERFFWGGALSTYRSDYGIPKGAHAHGGHGHGHGHGGHGGHGGDDIRIDLTQDRGEFLIGARDLGFIEELRLKASDIDYQHAEVKGGEVDTRFFNEGNEIRIDAVHQSIAGWKGALGVQFGEREFATVGEKDFIPANTTRSSGVFVMQERDFGALKVELGGRLDHVDAAMDNGLAQRDFDLQSASMGLRWAASETLQLTLNLDRAERAPTAEELFSEGPHAATGSYEIGDPLLRTERAHRFELGADLKVGRIDARAAVYRTDFRNFIYLADTGFEIDHLPVRLWLQEDAQFTGWELEASTLLAETAHGQFTLRGFADSVSAELDAGGHLPRIAPGRLGLDLGWEYAAWRGGLGLVHYQDQDEVAAGESETEGFTLLHAQMSYHWDTTTFGWEAYLKGSNLTDQEARMHTSFLKDYTPLMGRSLTAGLRVFF